MSKKFRNRLCVYCGTRPSTTADHVFSRQFFLIKRRGYLPKVPACEPCNTEKSGLETYLTAALPFGGLHSDAEINLRDMVPPRLEIHAQLRRRIADGLTLEWIQQGPEQVPTMTLPFESEKIGHLFGFVAKGLAWHHFQQVIGPESAAWAGILSADGEVLFEQLFTLKAKARVNESLGEGTFTYEGAQSADNPQMTIWRFSAYGGATFTGDPDVRWERNSLIGAITGSERLIAQFTAPLQTSVAVP